MHRIVLNVQDNAVANLMSFLNEMSGKEIEVLDDKIISKTEDKENPFDFSHLKIEAFKGTDPVQWQKDIRNEWE